MEKFSSVQVTNLQSHFQLVCPCCQFRDVIQHADSQPVLNKNCMNCPDVSLQPQTVNMLDWLFEQAVQLQKLDDMQMLEHVDFPAYAA